MEKDCERKAAVKQLTYIAIENLIPIKLYKFAMVLRQKPSKIIVLSATAPPCEESIRGREPRA